MECSDENTECDLDNHANVGVFLDVDGIIIEGHIQEQYARLFNVYDEYLEIEEMYQRGIFSSDEFGERIIQLFNKVGFSQVLAEKFYDNIKKIELAEELLDLDVTYYLVSCGPCYYIDLLAEKFEIPNAHVLCSQYSFDGKGRLLNCVGVTAEMKSSFVDNHRHNHLITVGIGDTAKYDNLFLEKTDIPIFIGSSDVFLSATSLKPAISTIDKICLKMKNVGT